MEIAHYQKALDAANSEMEELLHQRADIDNRLSRLKETTKALSTLLEVYREQGSSAASNPSVGHLGISDAIRHILSNRRAPMKPPEIQAQLINQGFEMGEYANSLAVIHNTLRRLGRQNEVIVVKDPAGQIAYAISKERTRLMGMGQQILNGNIEKSE
jgi:hypothetical protein